MMKVIVCLDDKNGMLFGNRRQSRDRIVIEDICKMTDVLSIHTFSEKLFSEVTLQLNVKDDFLKEAKNGEFCFVENQPLIGYEDKIEEIVVYGWNRVYPSDKQFDISLVNWKVVSEEEFAGYSHEKITKRIYRR
jgi:hypothetical protein